MPDAALVGELLGLGQEFPVAFLKLSEVGELKKDILKILTKPRDQEFRGQSEKHFWPQSRTAFVKIFYNSFKRTEFVQNAPAHNLVPSEKAEAKNTQ